MLKKRGQFTVFVILGIVIFVAFALAFCVRNLLRTTDMQTQAETILRQALSTSPIDYYVTTCIEQVTDEALFYIGMQGGNIYEYQNGTFPFNSARLGQDFLQMNYEGQIFNVSYGLIAHNDTLCLDLPPPAYPYNKTRMDNVLSTYLLRVLSGTCADSTLINGAFGRNQLQKLCDAQGPNAYNVTNMSVFTCMRGTYDAAVYNLSIQEQMQDYIGLMIKECVDFEVFRNLSNRNITVLNDPAATVVFARQGGFNVNVTYPFMVSVNGGEPITIRQTFQIFSPVRLNEVYRLAHTIITQDAQRIYYNKTTDFNETRDDLPVDLSGVDLRIIENPCFTRCSFGKNDDVLQLIDYGSLVKNKPFVFQFAMENRRPALDYIQTTQSDMFDIVTSENRTIFFDPKGYDPDENQVNYTYLGWREDYWQKFNESCCIGEPAGTVDCKDINALFANQNRCFPRVDAVVRNWTNSTAYENTLRQANYTPNFNDTGIHYTTVRIESEGRLLDWQNVSILVYDIPHANATGTNDYMDLNRELASIEDPYLLNSSGSTSYLTDLLYFEWNDSLQGENFYNITTETALYLPFDLWREANIMNITDYFFKVPYIHHNVTLRAASTLPAWSEPHVLNVSVYECLPHRNSSSDPYPYNVPGSNPFMADHTCCNDTLPYSYEPNTTACFVSPILYGAHFRFNRSIFFTSPVQFPRYPLTVYDPLNTISDDNHKNDVYMSTFTRYCSGDRGNICSGYGEEVREVYRECRDFNTSDPGGEDERCEGTPAQTGSNYEGFSSSQSCVVYSPGDSFEKQWGLNDATGHLANGTCDKDRECSNGAIFTVVNAKFSCQGLCQGGACTKPSNCYCNSSCGAGNRNCTGLYNACYDRAGFCTQNCDFQTPDQSYKACNCTYSPPQGICTNGRTNCWVKNETGGVEHSFCCQRPADRGCDGALANFQGACIDGTYNTTPDPDALSFVCECKIGAGAWFNPPNACCNGELDDDYENLGSGNKCCYNGNLMNSGQYTTYLLCYNGELYDCGNMVTDAQGRDLYVPIGGAPIGTFTCTSTGWSP